MVRLWTYPLVEETVRRRFLRSYRGNSNYEVMGGLLTEVSSQGDHGTLDALFDFHKRWKVWINTSVYLLQPPRFPSSHYRQSDHISDPSVDFVYPNYCIALSSVIHLWSYHLFLLKYWK